MAFEIQLCQNNSETNKIGKDLVVLATLSGTLKNGTSIIDPTILIESNTVPLCNYAIINSFGRKYFVKDINSVKNNLWELSMHVDVLDSYINEIKATKAIISRNEFEYNLYLNDDRWWLSQQRFVTTKTFEGGYGSFQNTENVLLITG